jgi:hypothetical protein
LVKTLAAVAGLRAKRAALALRFLGFVADFNSLVLRVGCG